jgi:hypothetical protein
VTFDWRYPRGVPVQPDAVVPEGEPVTLAYLDSLMSTANIATESVVANLPHLQNPFTEILTMSITDAGKLATDIKARIQAAKDRIASVSANTDTALAKLNDAADTGDKIAKQIEKEADDLLAQIGQFDNGGPA